MSPDDPRAVPADRYADRRWLNPPDVARELAEYVEREGRLPEEWLEVIREEQRNGKQTQ